MSDDSQQPNQADDAMAATLVDMNSSGPAPANTSELTHPTGPSGAHVVAGRYELVALLGQGGMGNVYKARDLELEEIVAVKTLKPELVDNDSAVERFRSEVKLARKVTHRNVARTFDIGTCGNIPYLTMEFVDGRDLGALLRAGGPMAMERFIEVSRTICRALAAAHAVGVIHRDLKPPNVLVAQTGRIVLTDFGIARATRHDSRLTAEGIPLGTPAYMAPEQVEAKVELDARADIYALGVMFFEMLSGRLPFEGNTPMSTALARLLGPPPALTQHRPGLPEPIVSVVERCLMRERDQRFGGAADLLEALEAAAASTIANAPTLAPAPTSSRDDSPEAPARAYESLDPFEQLDDPSTTLAVLPFRNSGSDDDTYVADGLTEELIDELSMSNSLRVRPRGAVMGYKSSAQNPRDIGRELSVDIIVDGSIRRVGELLRVRVGLISIRDGFQIWAERFKGSASDLFDISEQAARAIVEALTADELDTPQPAVADSQAVDLYLKARHTMHEEWFGDLTAAIELFEQALSQAPDDPRILAGAALAHTRATFYGSAERTEHLEKAQNYAQRALSIAPSRPEPRLALARVHFAHMEYGEAIEHLKKALASAPSNADAHDEMGRILREVGPLDTAVRHIETALELNPQMYRARFGLAQAKALAGDWAQVDRLLAAPTDTEQALNAREASRSRLDLWREQPRWLDEGKSRPLTQDSPPIRYMSGFRRELIRGGEMSSGHRTFIREFLEQSVEGSRIELVARQLVAEAFAYLGDFDAALEHIERGVDHGLLDRMWLERCPLLEPLRNDPRFRACRDRIDERVEAMRA